jgi:hypothetical protein
MDTLFVLNSSVANKECFTTGSQDLKRPATAIHEMNQRTHARQDSRALGFKNVPGATRPNAIGIVGICGERLSWRRDENWN